MLCVLSLKTRDMWGNHCAPKGYRKWTLCNNWEFRETSQNNQIIHLSRATAERGNEALQSACLPGHYDLKAYGICWKTGWTSDMFVNVHTAAHVAQWWLHSLFKKKKKNSFHHFLDTSDCLSLAMCAGANRAGKTARIIAVFFHTLCCWKPRSLWDVQQQAFVRGPEEAHVYKCLLDTDLHSAGNSHFLWTTASFPCQLKLSVGVRDSSGMGAPTHFSAGPCGRTWPPPQKSKRGDQIGGEKGRRRMGEGCESQTSNFSWQLDGAHLHSLMHHSSASLYHSAKHYIYFANANLC